MLRGWEEVNPSWKNRIRILSNKTHYWSFKKSIIRSLYLRYKYTIGMVVKRYWKKCSILVDFESGCSHRIRIRPFIFKFGFDTVFKHLSQETTNKFLGRGSDAYPGRLELHRIRNTGCLAYYVISTEFRPKLIKPDFFTSSVC